MKAVFNGMIIAESNNTEVVEGYTYFPPDAVKREYLSDSDLHTTCVWKGEASYYNLKAGRKKILNGAWYYPNPMEGAVKLKDYVAFYGDVKIEK